MSAAVAHGGRDIPPCGTAVGAVARGPATWDDIPPWATAAGPSAMGHSGSRPATSVPHGVRNCCLYNAKIQPKMS
jgi:hypothetical protein